MTGLNADLATERIEGIARHGLTPFSVPLVSHIAGNLHMGGCIQNVPLPGNIEHVVALYVGQSYRPNERLRTVLAVPGMNDVAEEPDETFIWTLAAHVDRCCAIGPTLVHCQAGLNRSGLVTAAALILHGYTVDDAIALLRERRSPAVLCNATFEAWLRSREEER